MSHEDTPNQEIEIGLLWINVAVFVVSVIITCVTGYVGHWLPVTLGIVVGLWAMKSISKHG